MYVDTLALIALCDYTVAQTLHPVTVTDTHFGSSDDFFTIASRH